MLYLAFSHRQGDNCVEISRLRVYFKVSIFCLKILLDNVIESYRADYVYLWLMVIQPLKPCFPSNLN